jgi:hypothetical protein
MSEGKPLLAKVRFREWLDTDDRLETTDLRVSGRILSAYNARRGYAEVPYNVVAHDLGLSRRTVIYSVARLLALGKLTVIRRGGRGMPNRYRPAFEAIPEGCPYRAARRRNDDAVVAPFSEENSATLTAPFSDIVHKEKGCISEHKRVQSEAIKGATLDAPNPFFIRKERIRSDSSEPVLPKPVQTLFNSRSDSTTTYLARVESQLRKGYPQSLSPDARAHWAHETYRELETVDEAHDGHTGDPIGGWAQRLSNEVHFWLDDDAFVELEPKTDHGRENQETRPPPNRYEEVEFENDPPPPQDVEEEVELEPSGKRPWRRATIRAEVAMSNWPGGRKFGPWLGETRNKLGVQVHELADAVGIAAADLFDIELGAVQLSPGMRKKYVAALKGLVEGER